MASCNSRCRSSSHDARSSALEGGIVETVRFLGGRSMACPNCAFNSSTCLCDRSTSETEELAALCAELSAANSERKRSTLLATNWPPSRVLRRELAIASLIVRRISETVATGLQLERPVPLPWPSSTNFGAPGTRAHCLLPTSGLSPVRQKRKGHQNPNFDGEGGQIVGN